MNLSLIYVVFIIAMSLLIGGCKSTPSSNNGSRQSAASFNNSLKDIITRGKPDGVVVAFFHVGKLFGDCFDNRNHKGYRRSGI